MANITDSDGSSSADGAPPVRRAKNLDTFAGRAWEIASGDAEERTRVGAAARARMVSAFTIDAERDALLAVYETLT